MKVADLIKHLQTEYQPDDVIVAAWWDQSFFDENHDLNAEGWADVAEHMEDHDWWRTHEILNDLYTDYLER